MAKYGLQKGDKIIASRGIPRDEEGNRMRITIAYSWRK